jgi:predicted DNA-binding protein (UPF0251 family)
MPRSEINRIVHEPPLFSEFKPVGVRGSELEKITLSLDEFEAVRLADSMGLSHVEAADEMEISRPTFTRLIEKARKKIADFMISGGLLTIDGGSVHFRNNILKCKSCGHLFKTTFVETIKVCPECNSDKLLNLAGGFGHGNCCFIRSEK